MSKKNLTRFLDPLFTAARGLTVVLLTLMVVVAFYEISLRTLTGNTPSWSKELVLLFMVWMGCLGAAVLHRERGHITLEFLVDRMRPGARRRVMLAAEVLVLLFSAFLAVAGAVVVKEFLHQSLPGTRIPVGISYLPLPITGLLLFLAGLEHMLAPVSGKREEVGEDAA